MENCVYRFIDEDENIIYIGKAKNLKNRLSNHDHLPDECYQKQAYIEYACFDNEYEMDFAERYYIQRLTPKYNTKLSNKPIKFSSSELDEKKFKVYSINEHVIEKTKEEMEMLKREYEEDKKIYIDLDVNILDMLSYYSLRQSNQYKKLKNKNIKISDILENKGNKEKINCFNNNITRPLAEKRRLLEAKYKFLNINFVLYKVDALLKEYLSFTDNTVSMAVVVKEKYTNKEEVYELVIRCN